MKLKSLLFLLLFLCFWNQAAVAQKRMTPTEKQKLDEMIANGAVKYSLSAAKTLLEANETTSVQVKLLIPPNMNADGAATNLPEEIPMPDGGAYRAGNWKILDGGGNMVRIDEFVQSYTAPAEAPPNKTMTISVELEPIPKSFPKIVLLQTLYFTQNENSFVFNLPEAGAINNKYVSARNAGVKIPTTQGMDPRTAARMSPKIREAMAQAQEQLKAAQAESGVDLAAVSSNAMALYDEKTNETSVRLSKLALQASNGKPTGQKVGDVMIAFGFKGRSVGTYSLDDKGTGAGIMLTLFGGGAGCGDNQPGGVFYCHGTVTITSVTDKTMSGTITTTVWTGDGKNAYRGSLYGKFTVNRSN